MLIVPNGDHFLDDSAYYNRRRWGLFHPPFATA
jgi:hypothetical protein